MLAAIVADVLGDCGGVGVCAVRTVGGAKAPGPRGTFTLGRFATAADQGTGGFGEDRISFGTLHSKNPRKRASVSASFPMR